MSTFTVEMKGFQELEQKLRNQTKEVAVKVLRKSERDAAAIWTAAIEARAPKRTGFLSTHITMKSKATKGLDGGLQVMVGPNRQAWYGMMQEFGTRFQKAHPFMRPAFEESKQQVLDAFIANLTERLNDLKE